MDADGIIELECKLLASDTRLSASELDVLIADDFLEHGSSGRIFGKAHILACLPDETASLFVPSAFCVRFLSPDIALITYRLKTYAGEGQQVVFSLRSSIWRCGTGGWQMVFHQGTRTSPIDVDD
ncbi:nuclear transport factor 2 family protein [Chitinimonas sp. PSY-7]|uniref:DUF4440 domain-containing protein n=1 Tax=Chitinimonas sp. PSY-7 TaxID=3459088 RepID=UPI00403FEB82